MLVCADGVTSKVATLLGYCTEAPRGVCSRSYIEGGSHNANFDGLVFYPRWSLPGCVLGLARRSRFQFLALEATYTVPLLSFFV